MSPTLALRCELAANEFLSSWVSRLAQINGIGSANEFCLDMGTSLEACATGRPAALARLSELTCTPHQALAWASVTINRHDRTLRGEYLGPKMLRRSRIVLCPHCIAEDIQSGTGKETEAAYGRTPWQLSVVRSCPRHKCALVEIHHHRDVSPHDFARQVRYAYRDILRHCDAPEPRSVSRLQTYVERRLDGRTRDATWLDDLPLHVVVEICELLGAVKNLGPSIRYTQISDVQLHDAGHAGFEIAAAGNSSIRDALAKMQDAFPPMRQPGGGHYLPFNLLYRTITLRQRDPAFEPVRAIIRQHIIETTPVGPGDMVLGQPVEARRVHSINTAAQQIGRHPKRLRKVLAAAGLIRADHANFSDHHVVFPVEQVSRLLEAETDGLVLTAAAKYLNASAQQARILAEHGFLKAYIVHVGRDNIRLPGYSPRDLDAFIARLSEHAEPIDTPQPMMLSIPVAAKRSRCHAIDIVRWIVEKRLDWVGRHTGSKGYASILVNLGEIERRTYKTIDEYMTIRELTLLLKKHRPVVNQLIKHGFLRTYTVIPRSNNVPTTCVRVSEARSFQAKYICMTELSQRLQMKPKEIRRLLGTIRPATDRSIIDATFYRREELSGIL